MGVRATKIIGLVALLGGGLAVSCGDDEEKKPDLECTLDGKDACEPGLECQEVTGGGAKCFCSPEAQSGCAEGEACEVLTAGNTACFAAITVTGKVFDLVTGEGVEGARVIARDANDVAASGVVVSDENGEYELVVPTPRDAEGNPQSNPVTLRADAAGYLSYPTAPRVAIPVDTANAAGDPLVVASAATDIGLIALANATGLGSISGKVVADRPAGTLIVAGGDVTNGGGVTGLADRDGSYVVFNVPTGSVSVAGYKQYLQLAPATATVTAGAETKDVDLESIGEATAVVSGNIQIVNAPGGASTSVILVVKETFVPNAARGEAPPGLRVGNISGDYSIPGVPDGNYYVLAAFENDDLVRDPDLSIGGTDILDVTVSGGSASVASFKVTEALDVESPDAEEVVSATPTFVFADDSSEDFYQLYVFDAFGTEIWFNDNVPRVTGSPTVSVPYEGPALQSKFLYQFRAVSMRNDARQQPPVVPISATEDLRGTFIVE
jgi:hypothetical protein